MRKYEVTVDGLMFQIVFRDGEPPLVNGMPSPADIRPLGDHRLSVVWDGASHTVLAARVDGGYDVYCTGDYHRVEVETEKGKLLKRYAVSSSAKSHRAEIHAPMPAMVVKVEVAVGDAVTEGQGLVVLEAMKMENVLKAHQSGTVKSILAVKGKAVEKGELLLLLE